MVQPFLTEFKEPVYMTWQRPLDRIGPGKETLFDEKGYEVLCEWQQRRCAMCGYDKTRIVLDHCHESGLVRGFLCSGCNTTEPRSSRMEWDIYRQFPPTVMLNVRFFYNDFGSSPYGIPSKFSKEQVLIEVDRWSNDFCRKVRQAYSDFTVSLDWLSSYERSVVFEKAARGD